MDLDIPQMETTETAVPAGLAPREGKSGSGVKNWAEDESVRERIKAELVPLLQQVRQRRAPLNAMWSSMWKVWTLEHENQGYIGRSNIYAPAGKRAIETLTTQAVAATFPGEDNFTCEKLASEDPQSMVEDMKSLMQYRIENTARLRSVAEKFYRQLFVTGNSPLKIHYVRKTLKGKGYKAKGVIEDKEYILQDGPVAEVVNVSNLYYWPEDVTDVRDAEVVFEDLNVSASRLRARAKSGVYVASEVDIAIMEAGNANASEKDLAGQLMLQGQGLTPASQTNAQKGFGQVDIVEVFVDFDPTAGSKEDEETCQPYLITMTYDGKAILRCVENPFWHKRPSYLLGHIGELPGRLYGTGHMEGIQQLQLLLNDQINQGMDCATWVTNPTVLYNPNEIEGAMPDLEPGIAIPTSNVNGVKFDRPPPDLIQTTSILTTQTMGWIMDFSGSPPVLQGGSSPGRAFRTATGIGTANQNAKVPLTELVKLMEQQVFNPLLEMFFSLDQQFANDEVMVRLTGKPMKRVDPRTLGHNWNFQWSAATQTANQQVKGQQLLQALQLMVSPPLQMALQKVQKTVNVVPLLKKMYEEVLGYRDFDSQVLVPLPPGSPAGQAPAPQPDPPDAFPDVSGSYSNEVEPLMNPENVQTRLSADLLAGMSGPLGASQMPLGNNEPPGDMEGLPEQPAL